MNDVSFITDQCGAVAEGVTFRGPVKTRDTSEWAARGWYDACGSILFCRMKQDGSYGLSAGLFKDAAGRGLTNEYYIDQKPAGWTFAGDHDRMDEAETLAYFGITEGDQP